MLTVLDPIQDITERSPLLRPHDRLWVVQGGPHTDTQVARAAHDLWRLLGIPRQPGPHAVLAPAKGLDRLAETVRFKDQLPDLLTAPIPDTWDVGDTFAGPEAIPADAWCLVFYLAPHWWPAFQEWRGARPCVVAIQYAGPRHFVPAGAVPWVLMINPDPHPEAARFLDHREPKPVWVGWPNP